MEGLCAAADEVLLGFPVCKLYGFKDFAVKGTRQSVSCGAKYQFRCDAFSSLRTPTKRGTV